MLVLTAYLPEFEVVLNKAIRTPLLFGGLAVGALGLGCVYLIRKWVAGGVCRSQARLDGKTVIITEALGSQHEAHS